VFATLRHAVVLVVARVTVIGLLGDCPRLRKSGSIS